MEAQYIADRSLLLALWQQHPDWSSSDLAQATGRSRAWVKKWIVRFRAAPQPSEVIWGRSRVHPPGAQFAPVVIEQILAIRDHPPEHLHRTPGPRAILLMV